MSHPTPELQPSDAEVMQLEEPEGHETAVKVDVTTPVRTQELPRKAGVCFTRTVDTTPTRLLAADHRRSKVTLTSEDNLFVAFTRSGVQSAIDTPSSNQAFKFMGSVGNPYITVEATVELWVAAVTTTAPVSVMTESWATGEVGE